LVLSKKVRASVAGSLPLTMLEIIIRVRPRYQFGSGQSPGGEHCAPEGWPGLQSVDIELSVEQVTQLSVLIIQVYLLQIFWDYIS